MSGRGSIFLKIVQKRKVSLLSISLMVSAIFFQNCNTQGFNSITGEQASYLQGNSQTNLSSSAPLSTLEDTVLESNVRIYDDPQNRITYKISVPPKIGKISLDEKTGKFEYLPNKDVSGSDSFSVVAMVDSSFTSEAHSISIDIKAVNDQPVGNALLLNLEEDLTISAKLSGVDVESSPLTYQIVEGVKKGSVTLRTDGTFDYIPTKDSTGADSFTFTVNDGELTSVPMTVNINISPINDLPVAMNGNLNTTEDVSVNGNLAGTDVDGDGLTYEIVASPQKGTIVGLNASTGSYTYQPRSDVNGMDQFTFRVRDQVGASNVATVSVNLSNVNDAPIAQNISATVNEDASVRIQFTASDADGDQLTYRIVSNPSRGTLSALDAAAGTANYLPNANINGSDSFQYAVSDGTVSSVSRTVTVTINPVNDAPVASNGSANVVSGASVTSSFSATDIDGNTLSYSVITQPTKGSVRITGNQFTYTPNVGQSGADIFSYVANDGTVNSNTAVVNVSISVPATTSVTLAWDANTESDLAEYRVYYGTDPNNLSIEIRNLGLTATPSTPRYVLNGLMVGTTYYFGIKAVNTAGLISPYSNIVSKTP